MEDEVMSPSEEVYVRVSQFRRERAWLVSYASQHYPSGSVVRVDHPRFHGYGIVTVSPVECPADELAVRVESGNVWHYSLETIQFRECNVRKWPRWIRKTMLLEKLAEANWRIKEGQRSA